MFTRTERRRTWALERMRAAVSAEPVKETMSSSRTWPSRSRAEPQTMEIAPGGKIFAFTISSTIRCVSQAVGEAWVRREFLQTQAPLQDSRLAKIFSQARLR